MKELLPILRKIFEKPIKYDYILESSIDFPSEDLPLDIWDKTEDGYILNPKLKARILDALGQYPDLDLLDLAKKIHIVGSIGTNLNDEDADIDIHIEPDLDRLPQGDLEQMQRNVMDWFKNERDEKDWYVNKHPFEVYLQLNPNQDYYSDTVYDLLNDKWEKSFKKYSLDYNPYEVYGHVFSDLQELAAPADLMIGELRRDSIDYERLMKAIKKAPKEIQSQLKVSLEKKLQEIEEDIEKLVQNKNIWRDVRHKNSIQTDDVVDDISKLTQSEEWKQGNAIFKYLDRYCYFVLVNDLKKLIDDKELTEDDIPKIEEILQKFNSLEGQK